MRSTAWTLSLIPTNLPVQRIDHHDSIFKTKKEKLNAIVQAVVEAHDKGQPVLVGTITIDASEELSRMLTKRGIQHKVLNAKFHELEAEIVADAGTAWCSYDRNQHGWPWYRYQAWRGCGRTRWSEDHRYRAS